MKRLERLTAILTYLQSRKYTSIERLVERFTISERTLYRDLKALQESGIPIGFENGNGYFIAGGFFLPPMAFSLEEARSFILAGQLARKYLDPGYFNHYAAALEKIRNKLNDHQLEEIEALESRVIAYVDPQYTVQHLQLAEQACSQKQVLQLCYQSARSVTTQRNIEPIGLTFYSQSWHLIAWCRLRKDYRDFSLARIVSINLSGETMQEERLDLAGYIKKLEAENEA